MTRWLKHLVEITADVDPTTGPAFDTEEDSTDALVVDFTVSALNQADGARKHEEDAILFYRQEETCRP